LIEDLLLSGGRRSAEGGEGIITTRCGICVPLGKKKEGDTRTHKGEDIEKGSQSDKICSTGGPPAGTKKKRAPERAAIEKNTGREK